MPRRVTAGADPVAERSADVAAPARQRFLRRAARAPLAGLAPRARRCSPLVGARRRRRVAGVLLLGARRPRRRGPRDSVLDARTRCAPGGRCRSTCRSRPSTSTRSQARVEALAAGRARRGVPGLAGHRAHRRDRAAGASPSWSGRARGAGSTTTACCSAATRAARGPAAARRAGRDARRRRWPRRPRSSARCPPSCSRGSPTVEVGSIDAISLCSRDGAQVNWGSADESADKAGCSPC